MILLKLLCFGKRKGVIVQGTLGTLLSSSTYSSTSLIITFDLAELLGGVTFPPKTVAVAIRGQVTSAIKRVVEVVGSEQWPDLEPIRTKPLSLRRTGCIPGRDRAPETCSA